MRWVWLARLPRRNEAPCHRDRDRAPRLAGPARSAGLAAALWATGQRERAYAEVLQILAAIGARPVGVADDPMRVYGICYQILAAVSDPQATALQQRAWQHMTEQAAAISSATQRARFLRDCTEQLGPQTFNF